MDMSTTRSIVQIVYGSQSDDNRYTGKGNNKARSEAYAHLHEYVCPVLQIGCKIKLSKC